jgi:SAM-dependent methyltransferase
MMIDTLNQRARRVAKDSLDFASRTLAFAGFAESSEKLGRDAQAYWRAAESDRWKRESHWRDAERFTGNDLWCEVGKSHLALFDRLARVRDDPPRFSTVLEWGCGGGANAVSFAPRADRFVGVDISSASIDECGRQVTAACSTPFVPILIDGDHPEEATERVAGSCDLFLCLYVFELITSQEYGARILRIAHRMLADGGLAFIQIKYDTGAFHTRPRRRGYRLGMSDMTTYRIDAFWTLATSCGLTPELVHLVPQNDLDERYAYFLLSKETVSSE